MAAVTTPSLSVSLHTQVEAAVQPNQDTVERSVLESLFPDCGYPIKTPLMFSNSKIERCFTMNT